MNAGTKTCPWNRLVIVVPCIGLVVAFFVRRHGSGIRRLCSRAPPSPSGRRQLVRAYTELPDED